MKIGRMALVKRPSTSTTGTRLSMDTKANCQSSIRMSAALTTSITTACTICVRPEAMKSRT
ncbi:hypothetical protein D3C78_1871820 [compost metagenome]